MLPPLKPDSILRSRYHIVRAIGQGGMGSLYLAEDNRLDGRMCAIKVIGIDPHSSPSQQDQAREQFYREASVLARLDHPNLPKVSDFFSEGNRDFLLHRDIKPANIKLTPDGLIKLVDFGLVKLMVPDDTRTITVLQGRGSAFYTPLEQYGGDTGHTDPRSDIYSLGATLYHLLTTEPPVEAKARFLQPESLKPPRVLNPNLSLRTEQAILWALEMHPNNRPPDVQTFKEMLLSTGPLSLWPVHESQRPLDQIAPVNRILALVALVLLTLSVVATLFPSTIPVP
jgi:serine/threonine protein kinase